MTNQGDLPGAEADTRKPIYKDVLLLQLAAIVFLLDQFSKFLVRELLIFQESFPVDGFFRFTHSHNTGSAFGIFQDQNGPLILVSMVGITVLGFIYNSQRKPTNLLRLSLGLQMGGAAGNLLDRVLLGHVIDFIDVGTWPIFNIADSSIMVGLALLAWMFLRAEGFGGAKPAAAPIGVWCPICDGEMLASGQGWHCPDCGVRERIDAGHLVTDLPVTAEQTAAPTGTGTTLWEPTGAVPASADSPSETPSGDEFPAGKTPDMDAERSTTTYLGEQLGEAPGSSAKNKPL